MTTAQRSLVLLAALAAGTAARAGDETLPKGAIARIDTRIYPAFASPREPDGEEPSTAVAFAALSADGRTAILARAGGPLVVWDVVHGTTSALPRGHVAPLTALAASPDGDRLATADERGGVRLWSTASGATLPLSAGATTSPVRDLAFSPDGRWLLALGGEGLLVFWDTLGRDRTVFPIGTPPLTRARAVAWSPDGAHVLVGDAEGALQRRQVAGGGSFLVGTLGTREVRRISFAPDGRSALVLTDTTLETVPVTTSGRPAGSERRSGAFTCAERSPALQAVATGDAEGVLRLLDAATLDDAAVVPAHAGAIAALAFSADGRRLVTGGADGVVLVWDVAAVLGHEPGPATRQEPSGVAPSLPGPRAFPPRELRVAKVEGLADRERVEPYAGLVPGAPVGDDDVRAVLVVDGSTGRPLPGAAVRLFAEDLVAPPGKAFHETTTDGYGLAWAAYEPSRPFGHWVVEAPGFAPRHWFGWGDLPTTVAVFPCKDAEGRVLDPYGRPLAGAELELFLGCGHGPAVRRATTADDGTFRLAACDPSPGNVIVRAPGCAAEYLDGTAFGKLGAEPVTFVLRPGSDVEGRVVDVDGWGVPGVAVETDVERTRALTDADGKFALRGVSAGSGLAVVGPPDVGALASVDAARWGAPALPLTLVVPARGDDVSDTWDRTIRFDVLVLDRDTGTPVDAPDATLVDPRTGMRFEQTATEEGLGPGRMRFEAPAGAYLLVPGSPFASHAGDALEVRVAAGQEAPQVVRAARQPRLALRFDGDPPRRGEVEVAASGEVEDIQDVASAEDVFVPAAGPAAVVVRDGALERAYPLGPERDGVREAVIAWPQPKRIRVRGVVGKDVEVSALSSVRLVGKDADAGTCVVETHASGALRIEVDDDGDGRAVVDVDVPAEPGATADAQVRRVPHTSVAFRTADGKPIVETSFRYEVWRSGEGASEEQGTDVTGAGGSDHFWEAGAPCVLELHLDGWAPRRMTVRSDGEQIAAWGDATLVVETTDDAGKPLDAVLWLDGCLVQIEVGHSERGSVARVELRGLDAGHHTLLVGAKDRQAQTIDLDVASGATRTIRVALPGLGE